MFWNHALDGPWMVVLGGLLIVTAWFLWRGHRWGQRSQRRDPLREAREDLAARRRDVSKIDEMEIRLHDFQREVEAMVETRMRVLEQLVSDADREIARLIDAIADARRTRGEAATLPIEAHLAEDAETADALTPAERESIELLRGAGFDAEEIARLVDQPTALVAEFLANRGGGLADAA